MGTNEKRQNFFVCKNIFGHKFFVFWFCSKSPKTPSNGTEKSTPLTFAKIQTRQGRDAKIDEVGISDEKDFIIEAVKRIVENAKDQKPKSQPESGGW